ncbi:hypothetical protein [Nocardia heshunensis]
MSGSAQRRFEEIAQKARRAQEAIDRIRGTIKIAGVRIEVAADGRITGLELADQALAKTIVFAHSQALDQAKEQVADHRRPLTDDPAVSSILRFLIAEEASPTPTQQDTTVSTTASGPIPPKTPAPEPWDDPDYQNPFALPRHIQRRYGI